MPNHIGGRFQIYEYAYYTLTFLSLMGAAIGLSLGSLTIVAYAVLAVLCILRLRPFALRTCLSLSTAILTAVSFIAIQILVHEESLMHTSVRAFVPWILSLIIVRSLCTRPGYIRRFSIAMFFISLPILS